MIYGLGKIAEKKIEILNALRNKKKENKNYRIIDVGGGKEKHVKDKFNFIDAYVDFRINESNNKNLKHYNGNINDFELWEKIFDDVKENGKYDYCICTHLLADVAFPDFVCKCINKIAKAGIISFPSKYKELSYCESKNYLGYNNHRWIMTIRNNSIYGFPKQGFIESMDWKGVSKKLKDKNEELFILWKERINFNMVNNDWLGPSPKEIINQYKIELTKSEEDKYV